MPSMHCLQSGSGDCGSLCDSIVIGDLSAGTVYLRERRSKFPWMLDEAEKVVINE